MKEKLNPIEVVQQLIEKRKDLMDTFGDEYIAYLEILNIQVFEPNGYKLFVEKIDEVHKEYIPYEMVEDL